MKLNKLNLTKKVKVIGISTVAIAMLASMSIGAFASTSEENSPSNQESVKKVKALAPTGDAIQVYDRQNDEYLNSDSLENREGPDSVKAVPAVKAI